MNRLDTSQPWELSQAQQQRLSRDIAPPYQGQIERSAQAVHVQRIAEDIVGAILRYNQSTEGKRAAQQAQQRPPVYTSSGLITRQQPALAAMQADLARMQKRGAAIERQVQRERAGYR